VTLALSRPSSGRHRTGLQNPERVKFAINELVSALGQKQTFALHLSMSALSPKADMCSALCMSALGQSGLMHRSKQSILIDEIRPIGDQTASGGWENTMFTHCSAWKPKSNQM